MITFKCPSCSFSFTEADKIWDTAIATGCCPKCSIAHSDLNLRGEISDVSNKQKSEKTNQGAARPISVIILLVLLTIICLVALIGLANDIFQGKLLALPWLDLALIATYRVIALSLLAFIIWTIYSRKKVGRWLALSIVLTMYLGATFLPPLSPRYKYQIPVFYLLEEILRLLTYGYWAYSVGISQKSKKYFSKNISLTHHSSGTPNGAP